MITKVLITKNAQKQLRTIPLFLVDKLNQWVQSVEEIGIEEVRKIPGFHDEPLKGERSGQRSIRLNRSYRAIYIIRADQRVIIEVIEVNKHDY